MTIRKGISKMTALVSYKSADGIAIVTIDNPPMNVLSQQVQKELKETVTALEKDDEIVCVVLTTPKDKIFIAGADIKEFPNMIDNPHKIGRASCRERVLIWAVVVLVIDKDL